MKTLQHVDKTFISELDRFLQACDKRHPQPSLDQEREITKHQRIFQLRDHVPSRVSSSFPSSAWEC